MNFFFEEYELSEHTKSLRHDKKAFGYNCFIDLFMFLGLKDRSAFAGSEELFTIKNYKRNTLLFSEELQCDRFYYIVEGATRIYKKINGVEVTQLLVTEGNVNTNIDSFVKKIKTNAYLVAVEDCTMLEITYSNFEKFQLLCADISIAYAKAMTLYLQFQQEFSNVMKADAKTKFDFLQNNMEQITNRFPLKYQASFMGMKAETLSRIRNEIRFKN